MLRQQIDSDSEVHLKTKMDLEQRIMLLVRENQTLAAQYKDAMANQNNRNETKESAEITRDALNKME